jgi:hypothetical protein
VGDFTWVACNTQLNNSSTVGREPCLLLH